MSRDFYFRLIDKETSLLDKYFISSVPIKCSIRSHNSTNVLNPPTSLQW